MKFKIADPKVPIEPTIAFSLELSSIEGNLMLMGEYNGFKTLILFIDHETGSLHRACLQNTPIGKLLKLNKDGCIFDSNSAS